MASSVSVTRPSGPGVLPGIARVLLAAGQLDEDRARSVERDAHTARRSFLAELVDSEVLTALQVASSLAQTLALPLVDVNALDLSALPRGILDAKLAQGFQVLPLGRRQGRTVLVTADPTDREVAEKLKFITQSGLEWVVGEHDKLTAALGVLAKNASTALDDIAGDSIDFNEAFTATFDADAGDVDHGDADVEDAPIVRFLHKMLLDAIQMGASDLHFEPYEHAYRVRFRIDGRLQEVSNPPAVIKEKLASRIKVLSRLDIAEKRVPQDGRMKLRLGSGQVFDFRVSTLPTLFGEKLVIRILDSDSARMGIDVLGYEPEQKAQLMRAIQRPYGMILVTGPTGSGKTVSLYTCISLLNQPGTNISTAEDPSEIYMPGINQVNVNEKAGLTFAVALRAFLRQDPDVIMVGEVRDLETADIAIKAAQTGHLVLSTLHTNDAPSTLSRLRNMGVEPFNIASSVIMITAQRLARTLCPKCKVPEDIPRQTLLDAGFTDADLDGSWTPWRAVGCGACHQGYKGRIGIYEVMPVSNALREIILAGGTARDLERQARAEGVESMRTAGLRKVKAGITSLEEVLAVTNQ